MDHIFSGRLTVSIRAETLEEAERIFTTCFPIPDDCECVLIESDVADEGPLA